jgi:hypothetical protein
MNRRGSTVRRHLSYANIAATLALVFAMSGTGWAATRSVMIEGRVIGGVPGYRVTIERTPPCLPSGRCPLPPPRQQMSSTLDSRDHFKFSGLRRGVSYSIDVPQCHAEEAVVGSRPTAQVVLHCK